ncbi:RGS domain-containing protein [Halenospora varia]|nr:RGS domain-containing protein [Halenospora varia]
MADFTTPSPQPDMDRNRLPTLFEVLSRRTLPPVDLFSFYIYMRDQQRSVDYLDFWLDVAQHMSLCRHYVRELRRSVMIGTPDGEKSGSKRSSQILENLGEMNHPAAGPSMLMSEKEKNQDAQMSAFLREEAANGANNGLNNGHSPSNSLGSANPRQTTSNDRPRPSFMSSPMELTSDSNSPAHTVARADIRASAEKILYTFLLPGAEREIILPGAITQDITLSIEERGRDDPEVFDAAKDYVFQAMERDAFPGFLRMKALGNLVPPSLMMRLIIGLLAMFGAFWVAFILIFLDYPRHIRVWLILPFTVGVYALCSHQYALDPILALVGFSEYTFMSFSRIREPYVRKLLNKRALMVLGVTILIDAALVVLFVFVPGKRL